MSRVGNKTIDVPAGVKIDVKGNTVKVEAKGKNLVYTLPAGFKLEVKENKLNIVRPSDSREHKALHGTARNLIGNMVIGLTQGFQKKLEIRGGNIFRFEDFFSDCLIQGQGQ